MRKSLRVLQLRSVASESDLPRIFVVIVSLLLD